MRKKQQIDRVDATAGGLARSTLLAAVIGGGILVVAWLPAEYGLDPTGAGRLLGLTEMGEIKQQLVQEADAEAQQTIESLETLAPLDARLSAIEQQLAAIAATIGTTEDVPENASESPERQPAAASDDPLWRDEFRYTLAPSEGIEVKLIMTGGDVATFEWDANGGILNHDTHGNGGGERIMYERGRGVPAQTSELEAAFDGQHGWFWRNRTNEPVTLHLRTGGAYEQLIRP